MREDVDALMVKGDLESTVELDAEALGQIVSELMGPVMQTIGKLLENNTAALEQIAVAQSIQNDRLEALEKQIRLQTPVSGKQVSYLNEAIRAKARELLDRRGMDDGKAVTKLGNSIRRAVLARYGIGALRDIPRHEYQVALTQIGLWSDPLTVRDVIREAMAREALESAEQDQNLDAGTTGARLDIERRERDVPREDGADGSERGVGK